jgi:prevent-host-death family protein
MATKVGMFDAKTRFSEIVEQVVTTGQPVTITNRGRPTVEIVPCRESGSGRLCRDEAFLELARVRAELPPLGGAEIRSLIDEGRR